jgi:hypothetical protein
MTSGLNPCKCQRAMRPGSKISKCELTAVSRMSFLRGLAEARTMRRPWSDLKIGRGRAEDKTALGRSLGMMYLAQDVGRC